MNTRIAAWRGFRTFVQTLTGATGPISFAFRKSVALELGVAFASAVWAGLLGFLMNLDQPSGAKRRRR